jgi:hypothetical protein
MDAVVIGAENSHPPKRLFLVDSMQRQMRRLIRPARLRQTLKMQEDQSGRAAISG